MACACGKGCALTTVGFFRAQCNLKRFGHCVGVEQNYKTVGRQFCGHTLLEDVNIVPGILNLVLFAVAVQNSIRRILNRVNVDVPFFAHLVLQVKQHGVDENIVASTVILDLQLLRSSAVEVVGVIDCKGVLFINVAVNAIVSIDLQLVDFVVLFCAKAELCALVFNQVYGAAEIECFAVVALSGVTKAVSTLCDLDLHVQNTGVVLTVGDHVDLNTVEVILKSCANVCNRYVLFIRVRYVTYINLTVVDVSGTGKENDPCLGVCLEHRFCQHHRAVNIRSTVGALEIIGVSKRFQVSQNGFLHICSCTLIDEFCFSTGENNRYNAILSEGLFNQGLCLGYCTLKTCFACDLGLHATGSIDNNDLFVRRCLVLAINKGLCKHERASAHDEHLTNDQKDVAQLANRDLFLSVLKT